MEPGSSPAPPSPSPPPPPPPDQIASSSSSALPSLPSGGTTAVTTTATVPPARPKLTSAMKTPADSFESKLKRAATDSPRGSLRFALPTPVISVQEIANGDGYASDREDDDDDDDYDEEQASSRSLLGSLRGGRRKRRLYRIRNSGIEYSSRRGRYVTGRSYRRSWRETLGLWIVLVVLGSAMGFVFIENADEIPDTAPGEGLGKGAVLQVPDTNTDLDKLVKSRNGAVSSDVEICSEIGVQLMKKGGNAVDAIIGTAACIGTVNMFASGIGGGGFAVVRLANGESKTFNFREMAPKAAHRDMYEGNPLLAQKGGLAFAIPGEVDGFWRLHQKYGSLPWKDLWAPSIKLNKYGFRVTEILASLMAAKKPFFESHRDEWDFVFSKKTGEVLTEGEVMRRPQLARTLKAISGKDGLKIFYEGWIAESLARAAQEAGGVVTKEDFKEYFTVEEEAIRTKAFGREFVTCQAPCSGPVLIEALNIAEGFDLTNASDNVTTHRVVEIMKWISAGRTELGDPTDADVPNGPRVQELTTLEFAESVRRNISDNTTYSWKHYNPSYEPNDPKGTSHISALDPFGNAVALTTTVNLYWGSDVHDTNTGIVLNSEMDDFSIPGRSNAWKLSPSIYNYIKPLKRPLSSMTPTVSAERDGKTGIIIGASGGSRIVTSVFLCIVKSYLWGYNLLDVIKSPRVHHQLVPEIAYVENGVSEELIAGLRERGHTVEVIKSAGSVVGAIRRDEDGTISAVADWWRKRGKAAGF